MVNGSPYRTLWLLGSIPDLSFFECFRIANSGGHRNFDVDAEATLIHQSVRAHLFTTLSSRLLALSSDRPQLDSCSFEDISRKLLPLLLSLFHSHHSISILQRELLRMVIFCADGCVL